MGQLGVMGLGTANGTKHVPIFDAGDSGSNVLEAWRVETASGTGFIPLVDPSKAAYPYLRMQTASGVKAVHDSPSIKKLITSFEWGGSMSDKFTTHSEGDVNNAGILTDHTIDGSYSADCKYTESNFTAVSYPTYSSPLQYYPKAGDKFTFWFYNRSGRKGRGAVGDVGFGGRNGDFFSVFHNTRDSKIEIRTINSGLGRTRIASSNCNYSFGNWYKISVSWSYDGNVNIYAKVEDSNGNFKADVSTTTSDFVGNNGSGDRGILLVDVAGYVSIWDNFVAYPGQSVV